MYRPRNAQGSFGDTEVDYAPHITCHRLCASGPPVRRVSTIQLDKWPLTNFNRKATTLELKQQRNLIQSFLTEKSEREARFYDANNIIQPINIQADESRYQPSSSTNTCHLSTEKEANVNNPGGRRKVARSLNIACSHIASKAHRPFQDFNLDAQTRTTFPDIPCHSFRNEHLLDIQTLCSRSQVYSTVESNGPNASNDENRSGAPGTPSHYLNLRGSPASISAINADPKVSELHSPGLINSSKPCISTASNLSGIKKMTQTPENLILQWTKLTREELLVG